MGLFDFLGKKKAGSSDAADRDVARFERIVGNKLSQNIDREEAIAQLAKMGTRASAAALLKRFDWLMDPTILDSEEKEAALAGIVRAGEEAIEPIRAYCRKSESLLWALKALAKIVPPERLADELLALLDQFDTEYIRNPEPKIQLITELSHHPTEDVRVAVEPFLNDASEPVRFASATALFDLNQPESVTSLVAALETEESLRIKNRICQGLADRKWPVPAEQVATTAQALPPDFRLDGAQVVKR
ncbi:MAG TPA: HEAT repeat domain-containing protein [Polyangiaceae bacterium]|nr:HEAT repeat domain-containing protein [Polyangiaceae bacterium]